MFQRANTILVVVDIQDRLIPHIHQNDGVINNAQTFISFAKIMKIPVLVTEQYPERIGPTVAPLRAALDGIAPISKRTFSCAREPLFMQALEAMGRRQIVIIGIETHVCIFQTAADLVERSFEVQVLADAVSSRTDANKAIGLERIRAAGGRISSVESTMFELMETSTCPEFKQTVQLIK